MDIIKNAKIDDSSELYNIYFTDKIEKIVAVEDDVTSTPLSNLKTNTIDVNGKIVIPSGIDSHVHFNDPGFIEQEDFQTGTLAAAYGGITTIIDMPCTSLPPVTNIENLKNKLDVVKSKAVIDFSFWGGVNGDDEINLNMLQVLKNLKKDGVNAFKIYTISGMPTYKALSYQKIDELFKLTQNEDFIFAFHAEDLNVIENSINKLSDEEKTTVEGFLKSRPIQAEVEAIKNIINIAKKYNTKIHIVHISSKEGLKLVESYKYATAETCPHYLEFTAKDLFILKGKLKTAPVVKNQEDKDYLREGLISGKISFVTTDHAGTDYNKNKLFDDFSKVYNGIPGTQFMIPYLFTNFYDSNEMNLERIIEITSKNVAKLYGLYPKKGSFEVGSDADFTIIEKKDYIVDEKMLKSKGKYSPFNGLKFSYLINKTILRGKVVFDVDKEISTQFGYGNFLKSEDSL
jgi:allantoinase